MGIRFRRLHVSYPLHKEHIIANTPVDVEHVLAVEAVSHALKQMWHIRGPCTLVWNCQTSTVKIPLTLKLFHMLRLVHTIDMYASPLKLHGGLKE